MSPSHFSRFDRSFVTIDDLALNVVRGGQGQPLLFLHGYPQTHKTWGKIADRFSEEFECIFVDLPGYGDSSIPGTVGDHFSFSKRFTGNLLVALMKKLGHDAFHILGHDRGARVAYRMALDHPQAVRKLGIIEVIPTSDMWDSFNAEMALKAYHWPFLAQPFPLPEKMIGADPVGYLDWTLTSWTKGKNLDVFSEEALESYRAQFLEPARIHAMCEDYRAGAMIDRELDKQDQSDGALVKAPLHFVYARSGFPAQTGNPLGLWRKWATEVTGDPVDAGHFAQEENPNAVLESFLPFFKED